MTIDEEKRRDSKRDKTYHGILRISMRPCSNSAY